MTTLTTILPLAMRDTALTVAELADGARSTETVETLREKCLALLNGLRKEFRAGGPFDGRRRGRCLRAMRLAG